MKDKVLQVLFNGKISMELRRFKRKMMEQELEELWASAYEIDTKVSFYELLAEMSLTMDPALLQILISFPDLLEYLYERWLQEEDTHEKELEDCIVKALAGRRLVCRKKAEREGGAVL